MRCAANARTTTPIAHWLGLEIIRGMKQDAGKPEKYVDGTILDPRDGKVYKAGMTR